MTKYVTETFFLPHEAGREDWSVPADIYNLYRSLQKRSETGYAFIPIRSMQYIAVLDRNEIIFVDSQSYAVSRNEGGRLILIAWKFPENADRESLSAPVSCSIAYYERINKDTQLRLVNEFRKAMQLVDQRYRDSALPPKGAKILTLQ